MTQTLPDPELAQLFAKHIRAVPDFPKPGILFRDITTLLQDGEVFRRSVEAFADSASQSGAQVIAGIESRGFIFGAAAAARLGLSFVPIRKPGKLPGSCRRQSYALEYGTDTLEIHEDAVRPAERVLLVDDLLATGGTASASIQLLRGIGAEVTGATFLVELSFLGGRKQLGETPVTAFVDYAGES